MFLALLAILVAACLLYGCGSSKPESTGDTETTPAAFTWSPTSKCATCHTAEEKSVKDTTMLAATHASAKVECMSCHTDAVALKSAHEDVTLETKVPTDLKLTKTTVNDKTCLSSACHNTTLAELAKKTAASTVLTDLKGTTVNPHLAPTLTKAHVDAKITCTNCHSMHAKSDPMAACLSCHHAKVFQCHTCHE